MLISIENTEQEIPRRVITKGSMQKRFSIDEEVLILDGTDTKALVIRERLLNSQYADLDFKETIDGVNYLVEFLIANGVTSYTKAQRVYELLGDGEPHEEYKGTL